MGNVVDRFLGFRIFIEDPHPCSTRTTRYLNLHRGGRYFEIQANGVSVEAGIRVSLTLLFGL